MCDMTSNMQVNYWWVTHVSSPPPAHDSSLWAQQASLLRWWQTEQWVSCQELKCRCLLSVFALHFLCIVLHWGSFNYHSTLKLVANLAASNIEPTGLSSACIFALKLWPWRAQSHIFRTFCVKGTSFYSFTVCTTFKRSTQWSRKTRKRL